MWTRLRACRARRGPDVAARRLQLAQALPSRARRPGHPGGARTDRLRASPRTVQTCAGDGFRESETERTSVSSWPAPASHGGRHARIDAPEEARAQGAPAVTLLGRRDGDLYRCAERPTPLTSTTDLPAPAEVGGDDPSRPTDPRGRRMGHPTEGQRGRYPRPSGWLHATAGMSARAIRRLLDIDGRSERVRITACATRSTAPATRRIGRWDRRSAVQTPRNGDTADKVHHQSGASTAEAVMPWTRPRHGAMCAAAPEPKRLARPAGHDAAPPGEPWTQCSTWNMRGQLLDTQTDVPAGGGVPHRVLQGCPPECRADLEPGSSLEVLTTGTPDGTSRCCGADRVI